METSEKPLTIKEQMQKVLDAKHKQREETPLFLLSFQSQEGQTHPTEETLGTVVLPYTARFKDATVSSSVEQKGSLVELEFTHSIVTVIVRVPVHLFSSFSTDEYGISALPQGTLVSAKYISPSGLELAGGRPKIHVTLTFK